MNTIFSSDEPVTSTGEAPPASRFDELIAARKAWINTVLVPWCQQASRKDLLQAAQEWTDIAGRVAPEFSLWLWCWNRFPVLLVEGLKGLDETYEVVVKLHSGEQFRGYPDSRASQLGQLVLQTGQGTAGPFSIDLISSIRRAE
jgi:hypothetical protein